MKAQNNPRAAALAGLIKVENGVFIGQALNDILAEFSLDSRDTGLTTELLYGTVRMYGFLDYYINQISNRSIERLDVEVRNILRLGAYQILLLDRIPNSAAVNESVKLAPAKKRKVIGGFINGVLRNLIRQQAKIKLPDIDQDPVNHISTKYSHPQWMVKRWLKRYGVEDTITFCAINNETPQIAIRVNTLKISCEALLDYFAKQDITAKPALYAPDVLSCEQGYQVLNDSYFAEGYYYVQNESSALVVHALDPKQGETIYDLCAAPGGKSTHLAQLMHNIGTVVAIDQTSEKTALIAENANRLGISVIKTLEADASTVTLPLADAVLVDAPCSGLGVLRHKPDVRWRKQLHEIQSLATVQREILANSVKLVKPGGKLVYSTCTTEPEENQEQIAWFLKQFPSFSLSNLPHGFPGLINPSMAQILPFKHGIDGFFICLLEN